MTDFGMLTPEGYVHIRTLKQEAMLACPHVIFAPEHYRDDESCRCDDPDHTEMTKWGYIWDPEEGMWT
jgi:hypothetical protein